MRYMMVVHFSVFRSGYTGEDGAEIICGLNAAQMAATFLMKGKEHDLLKPAGLGARDTLRLEAGMPLYGHELNEDIDPLSAGLAWAVDINKDFIGSDPIRKVHTEGPKQKLTGLFIEGPRAARQGMPVLKDGQQVGTVTSGAMSPTLKRCIAMALVRADLAAPQYPLAIDCRGSTLSATTTPLPFYKRPKSQ